MPFYRSPYERYFDHTFHDAMQHMRDFERPYWMWHQNPLTFANAVGKLQDNEKDFTVSVDVSHFKPNELKVTTTGHELIIEGNHEEKTDEHGMIERRFVRKYIMPKNVHMDAIASHLSRDGVLTITAPKTTGQGTPGRIIPIQPAPHDERKAIEKK